MLSSYDSRISVFHKKNGGVSSARNLGIKEAKGVFLTFVDSDDWLDTDYLKNFRVESISADFYISGALYDINGKPFSQKTYIEENAESINSIVSIFFEQGLKNNGYPWGKLFLLKIIRDNKLFFDEELTINEDHVFVFEYYLLIHSLYLTNNAGYHYLVNDNSGRKLSDKINTYQELIRANNIFKVLVQKIAKKWDISYEKLDILKGDFIYEHRLNALKSTLLLNDFSNYKIETKFWRTNEYIPKSRTLRIVIFVIRRIRYSIFSFLMLKILISFKQRCKQKNAMQELINDLKSRSTLLKNEMLDNRSLYEKTVQDRSKLHYLLGLLIRWKQNFKYAKARRIARKRGAKIGENVIMSIALAKRMNENVTIGDSTSIQTEAIDFRSPVNIGSHVIIGYGTEIITTSHNIDSPDWEHKYYGITIDDYAWIPTKVLVLPSCRHIGYGAVVGSGSVVVKDIEEMSVVSGNPAREFKKRQCIHSKLVVESLLGGDFNTYKRTRKQRSFFDDISKNI